MAPQTPTSSSAAEENRDEIIRELISKVFTVTSGEQLLAVIPVTKIKKGSEHRRRILALTMKRSTSSSSSASSSNYNNSAGIDFLAGHHQGNMVNSSSSSVVAQSQTQKSKNAIMSSGSFIGKKLNLKKNYSLNAAIPSFSATTKHFSSTVSTSVVGGATNMFHQASGGIGGLGGGGQGLLFQKKNKIRMLTIEKKSDGSYSIIKDYKLKTLSMIKAPDDDYSGNNSGNSGGVVRKKELEFILFFEKKPFHVLTENVQDKNMFLCKIVQLMKENFGVLPVMEGLNMEELSQYMLNVHDDDDDEDEDGENGGRDGDENGRRRKTRDGDKEFSQKALLTDAEDEQLRNLLDQLHLPLESFHKSHSILNKKLVDCEKQNIHAILLQQDSWQEVNDNLFICEKMLKEMGTWVDRYSRKLVIMQKDIEQIEKENNALEVMWRNHNALLKELDSLTDSLKFDATYEQCILNDDFEGDGLSKINKAVLKLQETLNRPFVDGMDQMEAVIKRKRQFQSMRFALVNRFREYLVSRFTKMIDETLKDRTKNPKYAKFDINAKHVTDKDNVNKQIIEFHREKLYRVLDKYETLMNCAFSTQVSLEGDQVTVDQFAKEINAVRKAMKKKEKGLHLNLNKINVFAKEKKGKCQNRADQLSQLSNAYSVAVAPLFRKEFSDFTLDMKATMKKCKDNKYHHSFSLSGGKSKKAEKIASLNASTTATSTATSNTMTDFDEMTHDEPEINYLDFNKSKSQSQEANLKLESQEVSLRVDTIFAYCMNTVCDVVYHEQNYCHKFFLLKGKATSVPDSKSPLASVEFHPKFVYDMMDKIFRDLPSYLLTLFDWIRNNCDSFYLLSMILTLERLQSNFRDKSSFLNGAILGPLLDICKQAFDKFVTRQILSVEDYRCTIKKISVVPFLAKFPYWVKRLELILDRQLNSNNTGGEGTTSTSRNTIAKNANKKIATKMFEQIEKLAETEKKHADSFRVKNYMFFISSMQNNADMVHDQMIQLAQDRLNKNMDDYIKWMIDWKFEDLFTYFSSLENTLQTVDVEDIVYQTQYSKRKLKDLVQKYCNVAVHVNMDQNNTAQFSDFQQKITDIYKRMDKHLGVKCEANSSYKIGDEFMASVHALVWAHLRQHFIKRFKDMHTLVNKCYKDTNIIFVPSVSMVETLFNRVEEDKP